MAHYLGAPARPLAQAPESRRDATLAYIGADMLPELLAESRRPRHFDDTF